MAPEMVFGRSVAADAGDAEPHQLERGTDDHALGHVTQHQTRQRTGHQRAVDHEQGAVIVVAIVAMIPTRATSESLNKHQSYLQ